MLSIIIILSIALAIFLWIQDQDQHRSFLHRICLHHWLFCYGIKTKTGHRFLAYKHHVCYLVRFVIL